MGQRRGITCIGMFLYRGYVKVAVVATALATLHSFSRPSVREEPRARFLASDGGTPDAARGPERFWDRLRLGDAAGPRAPYDARNAESPARGVNDDAPAPPPPLRRWPTNRFATRCAAGLMDAMPIGVRRPALTRTVPGVAPADKCARLARRAASLALFFARLRRSRVWATCSRSDGAATRNVDGDDKSMGVCVASNTKGVP